MTARLRRKLFFKPRDLLGEEVKAARSVVAWVIQSRSMGRGCLIVDPGGGMKIKHIVVSQPEVAPGAMLSFGKVCSEISYQHLQKEVDGEPMI